MNICFVILHYKDHAITDQCVFSILSLDGGGNCKIVIVDNDVHEPDEKRRQLADFYKEHENVYVVKARKDLGFSYANNLGYRYAKKRLGADCIIVCNNDITFVQKDFCRRLASLQKKGYEVVSPDVIRASDGKHQSPIDTDLRSREQLMKTIGFHRFCLRHFHVLYPVLYFYMRGLDRKPDSRKVRKWKARRQEDIVPFGACVIFMKSFIDREDKAFAPETRFFYEEYILARRCREKGYRILYDPRIRVLHESGKATRSTYRSEKNRLRFVMENTLRSAKRYAATNHKADKPRQKILYFMSVDWNWIAQRPHFFALALSRYYDVTVIYPRFLIRNWEAQVSTPKPDRCYGVPQIPLQEKIRPLQIIGDAVFRHFTGDIHQYDFIWLGTPLYARFIPDDYKGKVIYDYMDDIVALQKDKTVAEYVRRAHEKLVRRADYIFATSSFLEQKIRAEGGSKVHLIRNGFRHEAIYPPACTKKKDKVIRFGYVGTIAEWIDFPLLLYSLRIFPNLEYHFWGPAATKIPKHDRIISHGIIEHKEIYDRVKEMDCLIVPFIVNDIILAVDPVKLYEYISFGKNSICVDYPEVRHFSDFVSYYQDKESYVSLIRRLISEDFKVKYTKEEQKAFLRDCSWEARARDVYNYVASATDDTGV